jgi:hypothetical protein
MNMKCDEILSILDDYYDRASALAVSHRVLAK